MTREEEIEILQTAIDVYAPDNQTIKAVEEMAELTKAIIKLHFAKPSGVERDILKDAVAEEMADVEIMLEQLHMIFDNDRKVSEYREKKLERLKRRIEGRWQG